MGAAQGKCRDGQWSYGATPPVCTAVGRCSKEDLPAISHGRKSPYKNSVFRGAVYKYSCRRGFKRFGPSLVHCKGDSWDLSMVPACYSKVYSYRNMMI